jgi:thymidylate kinase
MHSIVTLSGSDGVGKTLQANLLSKALNASLFRFPDHFGPFYPHLKMLIDSGLKTTDQKYLFQTLQLADFIRFQEPLFKAFSQGIVVCDRYDYDFMVYCLAMGLNPMWAYNSLAPVRLSDFVIVLNGNSRFDDREIDSIDSDSNLQERVKKLFYGEEDFFCKDIWKTVIIEQDRSKDKLSSIFGTHKAIINVLNKLLKPKELFIPVGLCDIKDMIDARSI